MAINVSQAFHRTSANPVDDSMALTKAQMLTVNDNLMPSKYLTVCQDDGFIYLYDKTNEADEETGKFRKFDKGGIDDLSDTEINNVQNGQALIWDSQNSKWVNAALDIPDAVQYTSMPDASLENLDKIVQFKGITNDTYTNGYFYKCVSDGAVTPTYSWIQINVQPNSGGGGGDAELESAVTSNLGVGAIASGTTLAQGTSFTEFVQKLLITEIAPTTTFTASGSGVKEVGTSVTPTLTLTISSAGTGTPTAIKFYNGSTLLDTKAYVSGTNTYTYTMESAITTTTTVKGVLEYKKSDNTNATIEKTAGYTFVMASYYGAVTTAPTDKAGIIALTKNVKNSKAQTATFTLSNQRSCYAYPASFGNLTSIKDANNFEYLSSYTKTNVTVDGTSYNVYTLTDPVTASGFKQVYA